MQLADAPAKLTVPFAAEGSKNTIPVASSGTPGAASWDVGFPPETMQPVNAGGIPPSGLDFNGVFNEVSAIARWVNAGAVFPYDPTFSAAIGGYPRGALLFKANGDGYWRSTTDNNTTDPDTGGGGWVSFGGALAVSISASVYANEQQTLATGISKVLFDSVEWDSGLWDATDKRFVAANAGKYRISGAVMLSAPGPQLLNTQIWRNSVVVKMCFEAPQVSDADLSLPFDAIINCAAGDYLEVFVLVQETPVLAGQGSVSSLVFAQLEYLGT